MFGLALVGMFVELRTGYAGIGKGQRAQRAASYAAGEGVESLQRQVVVGTGVQDVAVPGTARLP
jgi:hypothetical protein